ncbi:uncharacterized protein LOC142219180 [Leptodactylus fuscus]|uniref:uncharacterized protein LOC142219180 n=1 Tax=Leptodactylus fuscus TaxID=238119 RepID=UPI003F4E889C
MDQDKSVMAESILNITLEIIYLLTGEDYTLVKKSSGNPQNRSEGRSRSQSTIKMPPAQSLTIEREREKILELTEKIIELLTREGEDSFQIKAEFPEGHEESLHSGNDVQCKEQEIPIDMSAANAHNVRNSSSDWEGDDNNDLDNSPGENCSFPNRHLGLQDVDINYTVDMAPDKSTFPPYSTVHSDNIYTCADCGKCFIQQEALLLHQRAHMEEKSYPCCHCGKGFKKKSNLIQHLKIHTGEKPFLCSDCGKSFTRKADLIKYQRIHTGEKPFPCSECGKCFTQVSALIRHRRFHSGEKPFPCPGCGKSFTDKQTLTRHQRTHIRGNF